MHQRIFRRVSRLLLVVMLSTFLSPSFAVGMLSTHDQLEHSNAQLTADIEHDHHDDADHDNVDHDAMEHAAHDHEDAHGFIGHLLGHMPIVMSGTTPVSFPPAVQSHHADPKTTVSFTLPDPPFRPPRSTSLV